MFNIILPIFSILLYTYLDNLIVKSIPNMEYRIRIISIFHCGITVFFSIFYLINLFSSNIFVYIIYIISPGYFILDFRYLLKKSDLIVAPDTGLLHLADFLGVRALGIFGPTKVDKHGPFWVQENKREAFQVDCPHNYQKKHGRNNKNNCMFKLTPEMVYTKILENL